MQNNNDLTISKIEQMSNYFQLLYQKVKSGEIEVGKIFLLKILEDYLTFLLTTHSESVNLEIVANFGSCIRINIMENKSIITFSPNPNC